MQSLVKFAAAVEAGAYPHLDIWVLVPGGMITGQLVSKKRFVHYLDEALFSRESPGDAWSLKQKGQEMVSKIKPRAGQNETKGDLLMLNVTLYVSGRVIKRPHAELQFDLISAWGLDTLSE
jgi:hypothetical protein